MTPGGTRALGATRLQVLNSLPRRHQDYFFEEVRTLCTKHVALASRHNPNTDRTSEAFELFSEVMAKLLGVAGSGRAQGADEPDGGELSHIRTADNDPKRDERVAWLIEEIGGAQALAHRYEDIRRRRHGGKWRDDGYRQIQLEQEHIEHLGVDPEDPHHDEDIRRVWRGVLAMAESEFRPHEDVRILLDLMAHDAEIQAGFGSEWPIRKIVDTLNQRQANPAWNDDRVDNAKKRLRSWIGRIKRDHGLDSTDLMSLFAQHARGPSRQGVTPPTKSSRSSRAGETTME
jgi:hypothetical protein